MGPCRGASSDRGVREPHIVHPDGDGAAHQPLGGLGKFLFAFIAEFQLGGQALESMLMAGVIAFILIALLMIVVFRLPGVVAVISLAGQMGICFAAVSGFFPNMRR